MDAWSGRPFKPVSRMSAPQEGLMKTSYSLFCQVLCVREMRSLWMLGSKEGMGTEWTTGQ